MPLDYETLRIFWWALFGMLLIGFTVMDGFSLGVAIWLPSLTCTQIERRILIKTIAPTWQGNLIWLILGAAAIFTAWPMLYALSFSGFYFAIFLTLLAFGLRSVGFKYRSKAGNPKWRKLRDTGVCVTGFLPALMLGIAIGNALQGVPFHLDTNLHPVYTGTFRMLLNPFALWCGMLSILMFAMYGAFFLVNKTEGHLQQHARHAARSTSMLAVLFFASAGVWLYFKTGYALTAIMPHDAPSNPLLKTVSSTPHAWSLNYVTWPWLLIAPALGLLLPLLASILAKRMPALAFTCSGLSFAAIISTIGLGMFPFILPSSTHPNQSLTLWDSSSSQLTLFIMLIAMLIFFPILIAYTIWAYRALRGKVTEESIKNN
ncbi:MAG: cytochrome d ubiquinol oxidase subunit II [Legionella sp.]|nr:cytochrome d ubiquinol oxidase subunit II [Legionella sp.]